MSEHPLERVREVMKPHFDLVLKGMLQHGRHP